MKTRGICQEPLLLGALQQEKKNELLLHSQSNVQERWQWLESKQTEKGLARSPSCTAGIQLENRMRLTPDMRGDSHRWEGSYRNSYWSINTLLTLLLLLEAAVCLRTNSSVRLPNVPRVIVPLSTPRALLYLFFSKSENAPKENTPKLSHKASCTSLTWDWLFC